MFLYTCAALCDADAYITHVGPLEAGEGTPVSRGNNGAFVRLIERERGGGAGVEAGDKR
jgi:hypothetical protein